MIKKQLCLLIALLFVLGSVLTGCKSAEESGIVVASSEGTVTNPAQTNVLDGWCTPPPNITYDPVEVTDATPSTLENTVWIYKDEANANKGLVLFFRNGIMTVVSADACYGTPYEYQNTQLEAFYGETFIAGEAIEGLLYFNDCSTESECIAVWSSIEDAMQFAKSLNSSFQAPFSPDDLGITVDQPLSGDVTEPTEISDETPESLDRTAWVRKGEIDPERCLAFFFKDGVVTIVSKDFYFDASYRYKSNIMTTDSEEVGYNGDVSGNKMQVTSFQSPYCELTRVPIDEANAYAQSINEYFVPFSEDNTAEVGVDEDYEPMVDGTTLFDDVNWTVQYLGKTTVARIPNREDAALLFRIRNNTSRDMSVTWGIQLNGQFRDFYFYNAETGEHNDGSFRFPAGQDGLYYFVAYTMDPKPVETDALYNIEIDFNLWSLTREGALDDIIGRYNSVRLEWN